MTEAEIREIARAERDLETAAFLRQYAEFVRKGGTSVNRIGEPLVLEVECGGCGARIPAPHREALVTALNALASSIGAGLVDEGLHASGEG